MKEQFTAGTELWRRAAGYGIQGSSVDATDPIATAQAFAGGDRAVCAPIRARS